MHRPVLLLALVAGLTVASPAAAQQSVQDGYGGASQVLGEVGTVDDAPSTSAAPTAEATPQAATPETPVTRAQEVESGNLPFTGLDIALLGIGGGLLLGLGLLVRRVTREPVGARQVA